jgi:hypothetical protein
MTSLMSTSVCIFRYVYTTAITTAVTAAPCWIDSRTRRSNHIARDRTRIALQEHRRNLDRSLSMTKNAILIYTAEGHPTALRCTRFRKKFGFKIFHRDLSSWNPGRPAEERRSGTYDPGKKPETEVCRYVVVEDGESAVAKAYEDAGIPVKVLKTKRLPDLAPSVIDLDAEDKTAEKTETYLASNTPPSAAGKQAKHNNKKKRNQVV